MTDARAISVPANGWTFTGLEWGAADAPLVLLLHGFPQHSTSWRQVALRLAEAGLHAVAVDQRGYSAGARPTEVADYALPHLVADAVAVIGALGGPVHLVGHDWGGVVGWQVAARHPDLVQSWTAVSTAHPLALNEVLSADAAERARFDYIVSFRKTRSEDRLLEQDARRLRRMYGDAVAADRIEEDLDLMRRPGALAAALNWYRAMSPHDADGLGPVTAPTAYVWGADDPAFGRPSAERTGEHVTGPYTFVPLEAAGHWLPDQAPDPLADVITRQVLGQ